MTTPKIQFRLHPQQLEVFHSTARYNIVEAGRRWGKTELAWIRDLIFMLEHPKCLVWWVAPLYKELKPATDKVRKITPPEWIVKKLETQEVIRYIRLFNGAECFFHSADKEDSLRGSGLHRLTIDEAPLLKKNRWEAELQPSLMDFNAPVDFIGTPKGPTWFSKLKAKGYDPQETEYKSFHFTSYGNSIEQGGFLPKANIDAIANNMIEMLRRQEIFAEELEGEGIVFRNINRQIRKDIKPYVAGESVFVGTDFGKTVDYTVNLAVRANGEVVGFDRYDQLDWPFQRKRTLEFCRRLGGARLLVDSTGLGDPIYDELTREYVNVSGYKISNTTKKELIENLSIMLDNGEIWFPGDPEKKEFKPELVVLKSELESFSYEILPSSLIRYGAPEGLHDDCIIALALAAWQLKREPKGEIEISFGGRPR